MNNLPDATRREMKRTTATLKAWDYDHAHAIKEKEWAEDDAPATRKRLVCYRIRTLNGLTFTPREVATWFGLTVGQVHVALHHMARRGEVLKVRQGGVGRYANQPSVWKLK